MANAKEGSDIGTLGWQMPEEADFEWVMRRWFEDEKDQGPPYWNHRTQIAWRSTKYVGCGTARTAHDTFDGKKTRYKSAAILHAPTATSSSHVCSSFQKLFPFLTIAGLS